MAGRIGLPELAVAFVAMVLPPAPAFVKVAVVASAAGVF